MMFVWDCCIAIFILFLSSPSTVVIATTTPYAPVSTLDTEAYMGRWFQVAASAQFILLELGGNCATADYKLRPEDGKVALVNQARPWLIPKWFARTTGFVAQSPDPSKQGSFTVAQRYLFSVDPNTVEYKDPGNYWIIGLGPLTSGQYQWAAVSNADRSLSFILSRSVEDYNKLYKQDILQVFDNFGGFDNLLTNKPIDTKHLFCFGYGDAIFT
jgi:lipocalin